VIFLGRMTGKEPPSTDEIIGYLSGSLENLRMSHGRSIGATLRSSKGTPYRKESASHDEIREALEQVKPVVNEYLGVEPKYMRVIFLEPTKENLKKVNPSLAASVAKQRVLEGLTVAGGAALGALIYPESAYGAVSAIAVGGALLGWSMWKAEESKRELKSFLARPRQINQADDVPIIWCGEMTKDWKLTVEAEEYAHALQSFYIGNNSSAEPAFKEGHAQGVARAVAKICGEKGGLNEYNWVFERAIARTINRLSDRARLKEMDAHDLGAAYFAVLEEEALGNAEWSPEAVKGVYRQFMPTD
jgi:hypothetical protein